MRMLAPSGRNYSGGLDLYHCLTEKTSRILVAPRIIRLSRKWKYSWPIRKTTLNAMNTNALSMRSVCACTPSTNPLQQRDDGTVLLKRDEPGRGAAIRCHVGYRERDL